MPVELDLDAYYAFDAGAGSGIPTEDVWEQVMSRIMLPGVVAGEPFGTTPGATELQVYADSSGRQVKVRLGRALLFGHPGWNTAEKTLAIDTADATNPRIDLVVLRLDRSANKITLATKTGVAAVTPAVPGLTQTGSGVYEVALARVAVAVGATNLAAATVTDMRTWAIPDTRGLPTARLTRLTAQTGVGSGSEVFVVFGSITYQTGGFNFDVTDPTRLYVPRPGLYRVSGCLRWSSNATGVRAAGLSVNGSQNALEQVQAVNGGETILTVAKPLLVTSTAHGIQVGGFQNSGSTLQYDLTGYAPDLTVELVRATSLS